MEEVLDDEASSIENLATLPILFSSLFLVCYMKNPLMRYSSKFLIIGLSVYWMLDALDLVSFDKWIIVLIGLAFGLVFFFLEMVGVSKKVLDIIYELLSVFSAIGWISILSAIIIDFISFLAFYFSINKVILSSLLLSAGNTIGDYFGNAALAKAGEAVMGAVASYSGQIFNNFIGFTVNVLAATKEEETSFDIFGFDYYQNQIDKGIPADEILPPYSNYFVMVVIAFVVLTITIKMLYFLKSKFILKNSFTSILVALYAFFFVVSIIFGLISKG